MTRYVCAHATEMANSKIDLAKIALGYLESKMALGFFAVRQFSVKKKLNLINLT